MINIKRGLDLPIAGAPEQVIHDGAAVSSVAIVAADYIGMKPTMCVSEGDKVKKGQLLFTDKKTPGVQYTAPAAGTVAAVNRGPKRVLLSVVIDIDESVGEETFNKYTDEQIASLSAEQVEQDLIASGVWTLLRTRPMEKVPAPGTRPAAIFVNAMDTNPLAVDPQVVLRDRADDFARGVKVLAQISEGEVFVCGRQGDSIPSVAQANVKEERFNGPHPAGLVGTHIHMLKPVSLQRVVWHVGYQEAIAIGALFATGQIDTNRVVSLCGPAAKQPRLLKTRLGANIEQLTAGEVSVDNARLIAGSALHGEIAADKVSFLSARLHQVTAIEEGTQREIMGYLSPGKEKHSVANIYLSKLMPSKLFKFTTNTNGSPRAMVPIGQYEQIMPLDILPTQLLRSIAVGDTEMAEALGCLELAEEDLALCTYVCPGKYEFGPILRDNLTQIEKDG